MTTNSLLEKDFVREVCVSLEDNVSDDDKYSAASLTMLAIADVLHNEAHGGTLQAASVLSDIASALRRAAGAPELLS